MKIDWGTGSRRIELLIADLLIVYLAGLCAFIFDHGLKTIVPYFGTVATYLLFFNLYYITGFCIFRTFDSFSRESAFRDWLSDIGALLLGAVLGVMTIYYYPVPIGARDILLQIVFAFIGMRAVRKITSLHYFYYVKRKDSNGSYGLSDMALLNMELSSLLSRDEIKVNESAIRNEIIGKRILVTGGAGSIGSELVNILASYGPAVIVVVDQAETPLHYLTLNLKKEFPNLKFEAIIADITDKKKMEMMFRKYKPEIVFHAAAYKHVSMMEKNIVECLRNNLGGTKILADLAQEYNAEKFILISSDKAVNPTGVMGCSKRICEIYCRILQNKKTDGCKFIITRFGNVLGSNGSVVPIFREQIRHGGPVTVTHPDVIRYFMLINEACRLVLEAAALGRGNEIFVFEMGAPIKIDDLARKMIKISRRKDIKIEYTGLQQGEKLYEEVLTSGEDMESTVNDKLKIAKTETIDYNHALGVIELLLRSLDSYDDEIILQMMHELVPEFKYEGAGKKYNFSKPHNGEKYQANIVL